MKRPVYKSRTLALITRSCKVRITAQTEIQFLNCEKSTFAGQSGGSSAEVTLNALNASESEVDVESLEFGNGGQVR